MAGQPNLNDGNFQEILRRLRKLETATPLNSAAIGRGGLLIYGGGGITIENGGLSVTGTATISGSLSVTGTLTQSGTSRFTGQTFIYGPLEVTGDVSLDGATDITGTLIVTGPTKLDGKTDVGGAFTVTGLTKLNGDTIVTGKFDVIGAMATKGTLSVEGVTTLKSDLIVSDNGQIKIGSMTILGVTGGSGQITFPGGGFSGSANGASVSHSTRIALTAPVTTISAGLALTLIPTAPAGKTANMYYDTADKRVKYIP